jgi:hypothetical protein
MPTTLRRLHSRGRSSRGLVVDNQGAMVGPDCILVHPTPAGFRCATREEADVIQRIAFSWQKPDWLFDHGRRIAKALNAGELALAQIYGVHASPSSELNDQQMAQLAKVARVVKANFNPDEPRDSHGRWTTEGSADGTQVAERRQDRKDRCIDECWRILERWVPEAGSDRNTWDFHQCVNDCMERAD